MIGYSSVELSNDEIIVNTISTASKYINKYIKDYSYINICNKNYKIKEVEDINLGQLGFNGSVYFFVVNDNEKIQFVNSICESTRLRQEECKEIARKVDFMIIIGGTKSSNTQKLYDIAYSSNKNCIMIQDENDDRIKECKKYDTIGIMSGASTPDYIVENIVNKLNNM